MYASVWLPISSSLYIIRIDSHADEGTEQGTDQSDQIVEEGDSFGNEKGDDTIEQNA